MQQYIMDNKGNPIKCDSIRDWSYWMETADRSIAKSIIGNAEISTVFLGLNHNFLDNGPPILYETMIFGGPQDGWQARYATRSEAEQGHSMIYAELRLEHEQQNPKIKTIKLSRSRVRKLRIHASIPDASHNK